MRRVQVLVQEPPDLSPGFTSNGCVEAVKEVSARGIGIIDVALEILLSRFQRLN